MSQIIHLDRIQVDVGAAVVACSVANAISYLHGEIFAEGWHRKDVPWWVVLPQQDAGQQSNSWMAEQLAAMTQIRQGRGNPYPLKINENLFDIGLLDIQVFMDVEDQADVKRLLQGRTQDLHRHNNIHLDLLANRALHDQMVLFQTLHIFEPSGNLRLHYHNIILGMRREGDAIGFLDMAPLLRKMEGHAKIGFVL